MTRTAALRASVLFVALTMVFAAIGLGSHAAAAQAMFLVSASLAALMMMFAMATPDHAAIPVRVRRNYPHR